MRVCIRSGSVKGGANEKMKHLLLTTIAAVVLVGCGESNPLSYSRQKLPDRSMR